MNDNLRRMVGRLDPAGPDVSTEPVTSESSLTLLENIMSTPTSTSESHTAPRRPRLLIGGVAAAAVALAATAAFVVTRDDGDSNDVAAGPPLELSLGESGPSMQSCIMFDVSILAGMSPAFQGTVTAIDGETVTLTVERWFTGGDAAEVVLDAPGGLVALTGGIDFVEGTSYLVTASDGVVNYCGYTGEATPDLVAAFEQAFPG